MGRSPRLAPWLPTIWLAWPHCCPLKPPSTKSRLNLVFSPFSNGSKSCQSLCRTCARHYLGWTRRHRWVRSGCAWVPRVLEQLVAGIRKLLGSIHLRSSLLRGESDGRVWPRSSGFGQDCCQKLAVPTFGLAPSLRPAQFDPE